VICPERFASEWGCALLWLEAPSLGVIDRVVPTIPFRFMSPIFDEAEASAHPGDFAAAQTACCWL
jgi:hypothetical protein